MVCVLCRHVVCVVHALHYLRRYRILFLDKSSTPNPLPLSHSNVLFAEPIGNQEATWCAKVTDFGMARELGGGTDGVQSQTHGTVTHMPPETLVQGVCNKATDVYRCE